MTRRSAAWVAAVHLGQHQSPLGSSAVDRPKQAWWKERGHVSHSSSGELST